MSKEVLYTNTLGHIKNVLVKDQRKTGDCVSMQCIPGRDMVETWLTEYYVWHKYTPVGRGHKCLWEQLVLTLSKQNVCLMKDTNVTRHSTSETWCKLYPPERKLANQPSLNLEGGAQGKIWPHGVKLQTFRNTNKRVISTFNFGYPHLTLKEGPKLKSDHIKRFLGHDFL